MMSYHGKRRTDGRVLCVLKAATRGARRMIVEPIARWERRRAAIAALSALDDALLEDIGISRNDIGRAVDGEIVARSAPAGAPPAIDATRSSTVAALPTRRAA